MGRNEGSKNGRHYFFRYKRGWSAQSGKSIVLLRDEQNKPFPDERFAPAKVQNKILADALARLRQEEAKGVIKKSSITCAQLCRLYLAHKKETNKPKGYKMMHEALFNFISGFTPRYAKSEAAPPNKLRRHAGFGDAPAAALTGLDVDAWLSSNPTWKNRRNPILHLKRMLNWGVKRGLLVQSPIHGYPLPEEKFRLTYFTEEQEQAIYTNAIPALVQFMRIAIRTGCRPYSELGSLTAAHVMVVPPTETKPYETMPLAI